jgi:hypothetical protein
MRRIISIVFVCFIALAASAQNVGVGNTSPNSKLDLSGDLALREGTAIAVSAGANTLTLPAAKNSVYRLTGASGAFSISSISGGNDGMLLTLINATGQVMTIANGAIQTNTGTNLVASSTVSSVNLLYNATLGKWLVVSGEGFSTNNTAWALTGNSGTTPGTDFVGTTDAQDLPFKTANHENMRLAASGALGLGTKTPDAYVNNSARIDIVDTTGGYLSDIEQLVVGGVGFGTHTFAVEGGTLSAPTAVASGQTIADIEGDVYTGTGFAKAAQIIFSADGGVSSTSSPGRIDFVTSPAGSAPTAGYIIGPVRMTIKNSGNVGINQDAPNSTLDVGGNIQISAASIPMGLMTEVEGTTPLLDMDLNFRESNKNTTYPGAAMRIDSRTGSPIFNWFYRPANNGAETDMMVLTTSGQLGIGTTSPAAQLDVAGTTRTTNLQMTSGATSGYVMQSDASGNASWANDSALTVSKAWSLTGNGGTNPTNNFIGTTDATDLALRTNNIEKMRITSGGLFGFNTTNPTGLEPTASAEFVETDPLDRGIFGFYAYDNSGTGGDADWVALQKARGTAASPQPVQNGDFLGAVTYGGYDGSSIRYSTLIDAIVDGPVSSGVVPAELNFITNNTLNRLVIRSNGNIGIGTTSVPAKFNVNGNAVVGPSLTSRSGSGLTIDLSNTTTYAANTDVTDAARSLNIVNEGSTANAMSVLSFRSNPSGGANNQMLDLKYVNPNDGTSKLIYSFGPNTAFTDCFTMTSGGSMGIGTTSPTSPLSVLTPATGGNANWYDPVNYTGWIHDNTNAPQRYGLLVSDYWRSSENWIFAVDGRLYSNGTINGDTHYPYLVVRGDGYVGVGTASPAYNLDVAGTMHVGSSANIAAWASQSIGTNGYARMGGVLVQWGSGSYNSNNAVTVTFPTAFTNVYSVTATVDAGANTGSGSNIACKVLSTSTTGFQYAGTGVFSGDNASKVRWMAIGN